MPKYRVYLSKFISVDIEASSSDEACDIVLRDYSTYDVEDIEEIKEDDTPTRDL